MLPEESPVIISRNPENMVRLDFFSDTAYYRKRQRKRKGSAAMQEAFF